jgi:hypothetical protein
VAVTLTGVDFAGRATIVTGASAVKIRTETGTKCIAIPADHIIGQTAAVDGGPVIGGIALK